MARKNREQLTNIQAPPVDDPGRAEYTPPNAKARNNGGDTDPNAQPPGKDRVYGVASRDRWPGSDSDALAEQHRDSRTIDSGGEQEEEEEAGTSADLTVDELKAALDEAGVEYPASAKKAKLVELYDAHVAE